ncbi:MAG: hypothetical protein H0T89_10335 [Deltaproteobacteria bacterium]|nr:hypothetical protein [Deltaproteobacteria bacterium]MDQ3296345.1 hypothetical protein [Myxococcota bacterium]
MGVLVAAGCGRVGFEATREVPGDGADVGDGSIDRPNKIFISSTATSGNLGGIAGADAYCQARATAAGLPGTFVALLWTSTATPADRVAGSRGWVDLQGVVIGDTPDSLVDATINPLRHDELGTRVPPQTFALWGGQPTFSNSCDDWTSTTTTVNGLHVVSAEASFDTDTYGNCADASRLICAETGHVVAVAPPRETGRVAFVTTGLFAPGGGLAAADALCTAEATGAGLAGSFRAFLASAGGTAETRFSSAGEPWRRVDGVRLTKTAAELIGPSPVPVWDSFLARTATGAATNIRAWVGSASEHCQSWSGTTGTGTIGSTHTAVRARLQLFSGVGCGSMAPLICLEE